MRRHRRSRHRGYILDKELAANIQVGVDNKDSVAKTLGRPSFTGQFNANDWYYFSRDTNTVAVPQPRASPTRTCSTSASTPPAMSPRSARPARKLVVAINPVNDKTPTLGRKRSFFDELFGNIGVLNSGALGQQQPDQLELVFRFRRPDWPKQARMTATPAGMTYADYLHLDDLLAAQRPLVRPA